MSDKIFRLDSNIDGYYYDINKNIVAVPNFIQVVNGTDGSSLAEPNEYGKFDTEEIALDISDNISISGHGIVYNSIGEIIAEKGNIIFRDNKNNIFSFKNFQNDTIREDEKSNVYMRDDSISQYFYDADIEFTLDNLIDGASRSVTNPGLGNLVQMARKSAISTNKLFIETTNLSIDNIIMVCGKIISNKQMVFDIFDSFQGGETKLTSVYLLPKVEGNSHPIYFSWTGRLAPFLLGDEEYDYYEPITCEEKISPEETKRVTIYNNFYKRHFSQTEVNYGTTLNTSGLHKIFVRSRDGTNFEYADINILAFDNLSQSVIRQGVEEVNNVELQSVTFDAIENNNYSISISLSDFCNFWYTSKTNNSFTIGFEKKFTGKMYWSVIYNNFKGTE